MVTTEQPVGPEGRRKKGERAGKGTEAIKETSRSADATDGPRPATSARRPRRTLGCEVVDGILCDKGHFNHPRQPFCIQCGHTLVGSRHRRAREARPSLGTLTRDDGAVFVLDRGYAVIDEYSVAERKSIAGVIVLTSPQLRRVDIELRLCDWNVLVTEHGSEQPVSLEPPAPDRMIPLCIPAVGLRRRLRPFQRFCARMTRANPSWARWATLPPVMLSPDEPAAWPAGWTLRVGERALLFESPFVGLRSTGGHD